MVWPFDKEQRKENPDEEKQMEDVDVLKSTDTMVSDGCCRSCESTTMHAEVAGSSQPSSQDTQVQMTCALPMGSFGQWNTRPTVTSRTVKPPNVMLHVAKDMPQGMARSHWSLEDYELLQELHAGYASKVHKAVCKFSQQLVAIKIYKLSAIGTLQTHQARREVRLHSRSMEIYPRSVLALFAAFEENGQLVLVQEYAPGGDLYRAVWNQGGSLTEDIAVQCVMRPLLSTLKDLHSQGIVHRDIKPENILLGVRSKSGTPANMEGQPQPPLFLKLADFGLGIDVMEERAVTRCGTLAFMAPEVVRCPHKSHPEANKRDPLLGYGPGADIWSLGVLAFELVTGRQPFTGKDEDSTVRAIRGQNVPSFENAAHSVSMEARDFICQALAKHPGDRPSAGELLSHPWILRFSQQPLASNSKAAAPATTAAPAPAPAAAQQPLVATASKTVVAPAPVSPQAPASPAPVYASPAPPVCASPAPAANHLPPVASPQCSEHPDDHKHRSPLMAHIKALFNKQTAHHSHGHHDSIKHTPHHHGSPTHMMPAAAPASPCPQQQQQEARTPVRVQQPQQQAQNYAASPAGCPAGFIQPAPVHCGPTPGYQATPTPAGPYTAASPCCQQAASASQGAAHGTPYGSTGPQGYTPSERDIEMTPEGEEEDWCSEDEESDEDQEMTPEAPAVPAAQLIAPAQPSVGSVAAAIQQQQHQRALARALQLAEAGSPVRSASPGGAKLAMPLFNSLLGSQAATFSIFAAAAPTSAPAMSGTQNGLMGSDIVNSAPTLPHLQNVQQAPNSPSQTANRSNGSRCVMLMPNFPQEHLSPRPQVI